MKLKDVLGKENKTFQYFKTRYPDDFSLLFDDDTDLFCIMLDKEFISLYGNRFISTLLEYELENNSFNDIYDFIADLMHFKTNTLIDIKNVMLQEIDIFDNKRESVEESITTKGTSTGTTTQEGESNTYGYNSDIPVKDSGETVNDSHDTSTTNETTRKIISKGNTSGKSLNDIINDEIDRLKNDFKLLTMRMYSDMFTISVY